MSETVSIRYWAEDDRPREKLLTKGQTALSDAELLAILIGTGSGKKSAVDLGRELLALAEGDLNRFARLRHSQLCSVKGIGDSKAVTILAALELGRRKKNTELAKKIKIVSVSHIVELLKGYFEDLEHEEFYVVYLNRANEVLLTKQLSKGGQSGTVVDPKLIFKYGVDCSASSIILAHNHPSGSLKPSSQDIQITKRIVALGEMLDMEVLDHVIFANNAYFSFSEERILK